MNIDEVYNNLTKIEHISVYYKKNLPDSLNYKLNSRVGDLVLIANYGCSIYIKTQDVDWATSSK